MPASSDASMRYPEPASTGIPPPPPGFTLDAVSGGDIPPPPPGYTLDTESDGAPAGNEMFSARVQMGQMGIGAAKEIGSQALGIAKVLGHGAMAMVPGTDEWRDQQRKLAGQYKPEEIAEAKKWGAGVKQAVTHPIDTATDALSQWMSKALPTPSTPGEAQERGAALVRGAENFIPGGSAERLAAGSLERAVAPAAERFAARGEAKAATLNAAAAERNQLITDAQKLGLRLTPPQAGGTAGKVASGLAGNAKLERELSLKNAAAAKRAAAADVGITEELSDGSVRKQINATLPAYKAPRGLGRVELANDPKWKEALHSVRETSAQEMVDFPYDINDQLESEIKTFDVAAADADSIVTKVAKLRERASANFRNGGAEEVELARAQRKIATAMEDAIERHGEAMGKGNVIQGFRAARVRLAKLYTIRDAMTESGELDLGVLKKALDRDEPLSGNLKTLARAKSAFDRSFQNPDKIREGSPVGVVSGLAGVAGIAAGHPAIAAAVAAAPVTRAAIGSKLGQRLLIGPKVAKPSRLAREARKIAPLTIRSLEN